MDPLKKIQERLRALVSEGEAIYKAADGEKRALTEDESTRIAAIEADMAQCEEDISSHKRRNSFTTASERAAGADRWIEEQQRFADPVDDRPIVEDRSDYNAWPAEEADQFIRMVIARATGGDANGVHEELRETFLNAEKRAPTGQGTLIDSEGGALVPANVAAQMLQKIHSEGNVVSRTQNVPITVGNSTKWHAVVDDSRVDGSRYGGVRAYRTAEAGSITASTIDVEGVKLELKKLAGLVYLTEEQLADGAQMLTLVNDLAPKELTFKVEEEIFSGNGTFQMEGFLNANAFVSVAKESGQAADTVVYENIVKMYSRMPASNRANAAWFINQDVEPQLFTMSLSVGTGGAPVYLPAGGASASPFATLMGRPVIVTEHNPTVGDAGDIVFADMSQYLYATKGGLQRAQSIHVKFVEGETALRFTMRNDGKLWWKSALTPAKGSNTLSPFVGLAARA